LSASDGDMQSVVQWAAPAYDRQTQITAYKLYKDGSLIATTDATTFSYSVTGL
jgi:hypothetical protein